MAADGNRQVAPGNLYAGMLVIAAQPVEHLQLPVDNVVLQRSRYRLGHAAPRNARARLDHRVAAAGEQGLTDVELKRKPRVKVKVEGGADEVEAKRGRPPKTKRSFIWSYFAPMESDESAMCFSCGDAFKTKAGNTTTLISHLRFKHPEVYEQVKVSQNEEHLVKARQKLLEVVPKSLDVFSQDRIGEAPLEMSQLAVRSSPIWTIFKPS